MPFYLNASGKIATQGANGAPVLLANEEAFLDCCCCPSTMYVKICCLGAGVFSTLGGDHTLTVIRPAGLAPYWLKNVFSGSYNAVIYLEKVATYGWQVRLRVINLGAGNSCTTTELILRRSPYSTADCPPLDDNYTYASGTCVTAGSCSGTVCADSSDAYAHVSDDVTTSLICECCPAITTDYGYLDDVGTEISAADAFVTTDPEANGYGWQDFTVTGDPRNGSGATIAADFVYENSGSGGACGSAPNNDDPQAGFYEIVVCFNKSMTVAYSVSGNVETQDADKDFARILRDGTLKVEISSVDLDGGCTMQSGVSDTDTESSLAAGTYTFRFEVDTYDSLYHVGMVHSFLLTFT